MPYIKLEDRERFYPYEVGDPETPGELNYVLTQICLGYIYDGGPHNYQKLNDVLGALECCKLELYRRVVVPYEEEKIRLNGDVY